MSGKNAYCPFDVKLLTQFKLNVKKIGHLHCKEYNDHYKGDLPSQNGREGGYRWSDG